MKFDEGLVEELEFRELVNQRATQKFSADEIDIHVQKLCDDGKVMKSDGTIYIIDWNPFIDIAFFENRDF